MDEWVYPNEARYEHQLVEAGNPQRPAGDHGGDEGRGPSVAACGTSSTPIPSGAPGCRTSSTRRSPRSWVAARSPARRATARRPTPATWKCSSGSAPPSSRSMWLEPLLEGKIRSAYAMTEPDVMRRPTPSSVSLRIGARRRRVGAQRARSGGSRGRCDPNCQIFIVMGKSDPNASSLPSAVADPRADGHAGPARSCGPMHGVRLSRRRHGHVRARLRRRARAGVERARRARATVSRSARRGSDPDASTTACARSAPPSGRSS
jgi:hypothetical protein